MHTYGRWGNPRSSRWTKDDRGGLLTAAQVDCGKLSSAGLEGNLRAPSQPVVKHRTTVNCVVSQQEDIQ